MQDALSTEMFSTQNRNTGFSFTTAMGRLGAGVMPYIILPLVQSNVKAISFIFGLGLLIGCLSIWSLPYDPMDKALDEQNIKKSDEEELSIGIGAD